jgi:uncharacterized membrane protein YgdD (TMEM256/DUF423 family)
MTGGYERALVAAGAAAGVFGVALSAAAAHGGGSSGALDVPARFLLFHAPALLGLAALASSGPVHPPTARAAGLALVLGLCLFSGDLARRALGGVGLFPRAAPTGGILLMGGWALAAVAAVFGRRRTDAGPASASGSAR